jgi:hypothetical protein
MEGLSAKSVVLNFICQLIIFLYLLDNDTSWMILASSGVGVCIEFWKIGKAMHVEVDICDIVIYPLSCYGHCIIWFCQYLTSVQTDAVCLTCNIMHETEPI